MSYINGATIKKLREGKKLTQKELAEKLMVSDKTISKWETGRGLPDISMLGDLTEALGISVAELLTDNVVINRNRSSNMLKSVFYVCPICGNVIVSSGKAVHSCCGITLPAAENDTDTGMLTIQDSDGGFYARAAHEMSKKHHISFFAYVTSGSVEIRKLYPEQEPECMFRKNGHGMILAYCSCHGLFSVKV